METEQIDILNQKLQSVLDGFAVIMPEFVLVIGLAFILVADLILQNRKSEKQRAKLLVTYHLIALLAALVASYIQFRDFAEIQNQSFNGFLLVSGEAIFMRSLFYITGIISLLMFQRKNAAKLLAGSEVHIFSLGILIGAGILVMSSNLLSIFLSIELMSISAYALTGILKRGESARSALRYFIFGSVATAIMLYGMSFLYGFSGTLNWQNADFWTGIQSVPFYSSGIVLLMFFGGLLFKISAVPFHVWVPVVYRNAAWPSVALFSVVPKLAALMALWLISSRWISMENLVIQMLVIVSAGSMLIGNFSALREKNIKGLLGWSSIAQAGFILITLVAPIESSRFPFFFYSTVFLIMNLGAFWLVQSIGEAEQTYDVNKWAGLGKKYAFEGVLLIVFLLSLAGVPPFAGFTAKLLVFTTLFEVYSIVNSPWILFIIVFGILNTAIAIFYYLRIPYILFIKEAESEPNSIKSNWRTMITPTILGIVILILFFKPDLLSIVLNSFNFGL